MALAQRARGTPRIALKLLKRVRDFVQVSDYETIDEISVIKALDLLRIDELGLDQNERHFLAKIIEKHDGGPVGLKTVAATIHEDSGTIEEVLEPYLLQLGFIRRTTQGRIITAKAYQHLGIKYNKD